MKNFFKWLVVENKDEVLKKFILKYEVIDNNKKIKIFLANDNINIIDYTKENEELLITKMETQINDNKEYLDEIFKDDLSLLKILACLLILIMLIGIGSFFIGNGVLITKIIGYFLTCLSGLGFIANGTYFLLYKKYFNDFKKSKIFLENKKSINKFLNSKKDVSIMKNVKEECSSKNDDTYEFSINSIDKLSLKELKQLLYNMKKELLSEDITNQESYKNVKSKKLSK